MLSGDFKKIIMSIRLISNSIRGRKNIKLLYFTFIVLWQIGLLSSSLVINYNSAQSSISSKASLTQATEESSPSFIPKYSETNKVNESISLVKQFHLEFFSVHIPELKQNYLTTIIRNDQSFSCIEPLLKQSRPRTPPEILS